jgi:hypothetical protein
VVDGAMVDGYDLKDEVNADDCTKMQRARRVSETKMPKPRSRGNHPNQSGTLSGTKPTSCQSSETPFVSVVEFLSLYQHIVKKRTGWVTALNLLYVDTMVSSPTFSQ